MGVNHPTGGGQKCGYHTHSFHIKPRVNLGAKVFSSRTESLAFVKETSFFFVRSRNIFLSVVHKFDLLIVPYHHNYLSRLSQSTHHHAFSNNSQPTQQPTQQLSHGDHLSHEHPGTHEQSLLRDRRADHPAPLEDIDDVHHPVAGRSTGKRVSAGLPAVRT